jgi:hypothetical protein
VFEAANASIERDFQLPVIATVFQGRLLAASGATGVPGQRVIVRNAEGVELTRVTTGDGGHYVAAPVYATGTVTVGARVSRSGYVVETVQNVVIGATSGTVDLDLMLDATAITGSVRDSVGGNVNARVTVVGDDGNVYREVWTNQAGDYIVLGVPPGSFSLMAERASTPIQSTVDAEMPASQLVDVDVTVAATGTVSGEFTQGEASYVGLVAGAVAPGYVYIEPTNNVGVFTIQNVPAGEVSIGAVANSAGYRRGTATATVTAGNTTAVTIVPVPMSLIVGQVTGQGNAFATAYVYATGGSGPLGSFATNTSSDPSGVFRTFVPAGEVRATVWSQQGMVGKASAIAVAGPSPMTVPLGNSVVLPQSYVNPDGFQYAINYDARLEGGGSPTAQDPFGGTQFLTVNGSSMCCEDAALVGASARHLTIGPSPYDAFELTRHVFVAETGGYARYVESIKNISGVALPVTVRLYAPAASGNFTRFIVTPSTSGRRFIVRDDGFGRAPQQATVANVFAGAGAIGTTPRIAPVQNGEDDVAVTWTFTVPPGETRSVMHFAAQRAVNAGGDAQTIAEALVNLTAADALTGLSPAERAAIVNFVVPE